MPDNSDIREVETGGPVRPKRRFDQRDWDYIAEYVIEEYERRKKARSDREKHWKEVDRQIAMEPDIGFKKLPNGEMDQNKLWMAEMELPLQAQALEVLTADARRMLFPDTGPWFRAHAEMTDEYLDRTDFSALVMGDELEVPSQINQDNADKLVEGFLLNIFRQYELETRYDKINAESFKYGMGVGRARMETKNVYIHEARGTVRREKKKIPVLVPVSIKNLYLDDPKPSMHSAQVLGPAHIAEDWIRLENLRLAAQKGATDPEDEDGGWMPDAVRRLEPDDNGYVKVLEMEGDIVVPRKTVRSVVIPGAIVTVVIGGKDKGGDVTKAVIRFRFRKHQFSSYLLHPYHYEGSDDIYPTSPLMKGRTVQMMATDALNRLMDSAMLKNAPPVGYDRNDMVFGQDGGPRIHPYAQWGTTDLVKVYNEIGGDPSALANVLTLAINLYAELTGILPARLGAQTVSHTTAFAKDAELQRGAVRTVDYVRQIGDGAVTRWLDMAYIMGRDGMGSNETMSFYIDAYGGYVEVQKRHLPERSGFEWFGSGGPAEEQQKMRSRLQSLQLGLQMDQLNVQMGGEPTIDIGAAIRETLRNGGWTDIDVITRLETAAGTAGAQQQANPGAATVALQQLGLAS